MASLLTNGLYMTTSGGTLTISSGAISISDDGYFVIAAETGASDDLDTINITPSGVSLTIIKIIADTGDTITVKNDTGNIALNADEDLELTDDTLLALFYDGTNWRDLHYEPAGVTAHGAIYVDDGAATQAFTAATPAKLTLFAANGPSNGTTPDHTNDQITVLSAGVWKIDAQFSITSTINNVVFSFDAAVGGASQWPSCQRKVGTGADVGSCSFVGTLSLSANDIVTVIVTTDQNTTMTLVDAQLVVERIE